MPSYSQYKRQLAVLDADDTDIEAWITVKGNHIPIKKGQSKEEAVKSFIESKNGGKSAAPKKDSKPYTVQQITGKAPFDPMKTDDKFKYQLLDRMRQDNDYWLKNGKNDKNLWAGNPKEQIATMRKLHNSLSEKPEWLTEEQINEYETKMLGTPKNKMSKPSSATGGGESTNASQHDLNRNGSAEHPYTFHEDAGHGWLAVPLGDLKGLNLDISTFSYTDGKYVYLEEDADAPAFEKAYKEKYGADPVFNNQYDGDRSDIRTMKSYKSEKKEEQQKSSGSINNIFQQANAGLQSFVDDTGYQPQTTFWSDFGIAEPFGEKAVEDTYNRAFREWKNDKVYLTELSMMLNWKLWQHYDKGNDKMARLYDKLWKQTDKYAHTHLKGDDLQYYIRTTD